MECDDDGSNGGGGVVGDITGAAMDSIATAVTATRDGVATAVTATRDGVATAVTATRDGVATAVTATRDGVATAVTATRDGVATAVTATRDGVATAVTATKDSVATAVTATRDGVATAVTATRDGVATAVTATKDSVILSCLPCRVQLKSDDKLSIFQWPLRLATLFVAVLCNLLDTSPSGTPFFMLLVYFAWLTIAAVPSFLMESYSLGIIILFTTWPYMFRALLGDPSTMINFAALDNPSHLAHGDAETVSSAQASMNKKLRKERHAKRVDLRGVVGLNRPSVAWPTLVLAAFSLSLWLLSFVLGIMNVVPLWACFFLSTCGAFVSFTPLHDASHVSVIPCNRVLNDWVGRLCGAPLFVPFSGFKFLHLTHHRYVNEDTVDPDAWPGKDPMILMPLRWATIFQYYVYWLFSYIAWVSRDPSRKMRVSRLLRIDGVVGEFLATLVLYSVVQCVLWFLGFGPVVVACWILPQLAATFSLMYFFDYLPHRPHRVPARVDPYKATNVTTFPWELPITILMLFQNYHNIHHLVPYVPFYNYRKVWRARRSELLKRGTRELPIFLKRNRAHYFPELDKRDPSMLDLQAYVKELSDLCFSFPTSPMNSKGNRPGFWPTGVPRVELDSDVISSVPVERKKKLD